MRWPTPYNFKKLIYIYYLLLDCICCIDNVRWYDALSILFVSWKIYVIIPIPVSVVCVRVCMYVCTYVRISCVDNIWIEAYTYGMPNGHTNFCKISLYRIHICICICTCIYIDASNNSTVIPMTIIPCSDRINILYDIHTFPLNPVAKYIYIINEWP